MDKLWKVAKPAAIAAALFLAGTLAGCTRSAIHEAPPHIIASLSDHQYFWFLYRGDQKPELKIWRVSTDAPVYERFEAPVPVEENFRDWQLDGGWIWYLTDTGLWRIGRFPPDTGKVEKFEPDLINVEAIGSHSVVLVENARIVVGGENGLFLFDRQGRDLTKISGQRVAKLRRTPYGVVVFTDRSFFLLDTTLADPALKKLTLKNSKDWSEVPRGAYVTGDPERAAVAAMIDRSTMLFYDLDDLGIEFEAREYLAEATYYGGQRWLLTSKPRLLVFTPGGEGLREYCLYHVEGIVPEFVVQDGRLRCGPIVVEERRDEPIVGAVRFWPGDIKPLPPTASNTSVSDVKFIEDEATPEKLDVEEAPEELDVEETPEKKEEVEE